MLIPRREGFDDPAQEAEETRILFVGATRAREELRVGQAAAHSGTKLDGGRDEAGCEWQVRRNGGDRPPG